MTSKFLYSNMSWQPPGLSVKETQMYFKNFPQSKIPTIGTAGEKYRLDTILKQIPKQDIRYYIIY